MKQLALLLAGFALYSASLRAQSSSGVPESHRPPPGMCRIWIDGVPPTHQPAPTDCATAIRKRPMNARVVFGSDASAGSGRGVAPAPRVQSNFAPSHEPDRNVQQQRDEQDRQRIAQQQRDEQDRQRIAQQQRDEQERQRIEAQRQREEQQKREASHAPPPQTQHDPERAAPQQRPRSEKAQRPPQQSHSGRRPR